MSRAGAWILEDQCWHEGSALTGLRPNSPVLLIEDVPYLTRLPHHWQKLVLWVSAMRHFAQELRQRGFDVVYHRLCTQPSLAVEEFVRRFKLSELRIMEPNDYPRAVAIRQMKLACQLQLTENNLFLNSNAEFARYANGKKQLVMEFFYRQMRKKLGLLMEKDGEPAGGKWNFDTENRIGKIPPLLTVPEPYRPPLDAITREAFADVKTFFKERYFGQMPSQPDGKFIWPVTHEQATAQLEHFLQLKLMNFGPYEDAMSLRSWSLFHSMLSPAMNCGLLHPAVIVEWIRKISGERPLRVPMNSVEGFTRQIIGWREFIRGVYWLEMSKPHSTAYTHRNELAANYPLPAFYWTGQTEMVCMRESLKPVIDVAYSHHIPRLMVLANFALLHGINPQGVNDWFTYAYADGYEWVTTPNVVGMALYADGGIVATKPYAAGGAYINRMSDYCDECPYDPAVSVGPKACPFTRAYWPFIARHAKRLSANSRASMAVRGVNRLDPKDLQQRSEEMDRWLVSLPIYNP